MEVGETYLGQVIRIVPLDFVESLMVKKASAYFKHFTENR